jgi:hypothetical protein
MTMPINYRAMLAAAPTSMIEDILAGWTGEGREEIATVLEERREEELRLALDRAAERAAWRREVGFGRHGVRRDEETWLAWVVFPGTDPRSDEELVEMLGWVPFYSGPGRAFAHGAHVRRRGSRILVIQGGGLDI